MISYNVYRGVAKDTSEFIHSTNIYSIPSPNGDRVFLGETVQNNDGSFKIDWKEIYTDTFAEYSGFDDDNGEGIYEGDYVQFGEDIFGRVSIHWTGKFIITYTKDTKICMKNLHTIAEDTEHSLYKVSYGNLEER